MEEKELTLPVDPEQRTGRLPLLKFVASTEPLGGSCMLTVGRGVVVCGRIGRVLPFSKAVSQLAPCYRIRHLNSGEDGSNDLRFTSFRLHAVRCIATAARWPSR